MTTRAARFVPSTHSTLCVRSRGWNNVKNISSSSSIFSFKNTNTVMMMIVNANTSYSDRESLNGRNFHSHQGPLKFQFGENFLNDLLAKFREKQLATYLKDVEEEFHKISKHLVAEVEKFNENPEQKISNELLASIFTLIQKCLAIIPHESTTTANIVMNPFRISPKFFFSNTLGMKILDICKQAQLLAVKGVLHEWFHLNELKKFVRPTDLRWKEHFFIVPIHEMDDAYYLFLCLVHLLSNAAYANQKPFFPHNRYSLIASAYFYYMTLYDSSNKRPISQYEHIVQLAQDYRNMKKLYLEQDKNNNEDDFDWFVDLETNLPIHLGAFIRALEIVAQRMDLDEEASEDLSEELWKALVRLDSECLELNPKNPYILYLKIVCYRCWIVQQTDSGLALEHIFKAIELCEQALEVMNSAKTHYLPKLEKLMLEKTTLAAPEEKRINNLKFTPFLFLKSSLLWHATEELPSDQGYLYATQALDCITQVESFSRVPVYHGIHLYQKAFCYYACNQFEQVIHLANVFSNEFKDLIEEQSLIIDVILLAANSILALGHAERCMEKLEEYLVEYNHHPMLRFEKLVSKIPCQIQERLTRDCEQS
ncbi:hypothetical protein C9374_012430 [Naegleria lovaniensis]|uniref:Uncharacterized protein n=1 Tax=Naegleria lovaniensis TaxID=51637 RepID=A0AA88GW84_NAELO|nr:uncharacterized protein C9374_012430 [Naegleria lovaniensis]KAG2392178.1 hypothetical protein C9374_012430 [Naegleria lovaniensis]